MKTTIVILIIAGLTSIAIQIYWDKKLDRKLDDIDKLLCNPEVLNEHP